MKGKIALITGANRGLGFETAKKLAEMGSEVVVTSRSPEKGKAAVAKISGMGVKVHFQTLDSSNEESILGVGKFLKSEFGRLDILVNNAGVFLEEISKPSPFSTSGETFRKTFETNTLGPFLLCQQLLPLMIKNNWGRIVNVSSGMGQLSDMGAGYPAYRMSKSALNAVTRVFAAETQGKNILVNSVCPGWVKTDMGGAGAQRELAEGIAGIVWAATLPDGGPSGGFFRDGKQIDW
jgi:NAD(P)-dependent dehydrogenase (short-subunit alcohol dehydrogenase family)